MSSPQIPDTLQKALASLTSKMEKLNISSTKQSEESSNSSTSRPQLVTGSSTASSDGTPYSSSISSSSSSSKSSSRTDLTTSTTTSHPQYNCYKPQLCPKTGKAIHALSREYAKPEEEVDVAEALARGPLPGRFRTYGGGRQDSEREKREEFERIKRELRGFGH